MGWPAIMPLMLHSQTWGVNAQLLLRSASHKKSQHLHNLQGYLCVLTALICRSLRLRRNYDEKESAIYAWRKSNAFTSLTTKC